MFNASVPLNPIENIWHLAVPAPKLSLKRVFLDYDDVIGAET
jgi:hypothetical protein